MKNIWMLTAANFRKNTSQAISLLAFVLVAAMLLNLGLVIFTGIGKFFDYRAEQNHMAHYTTIYYTGAESIDKGLEFFDNYSGVTETETLSAIGGMGDFFTNDLKSTGFIFFVADTGNQRMDAPSVVGESLPFEGDAIYIPYFMMLSGGYRIGDAYKLNLSGTELNFTIAGGIEEIMFGAQMNTIYRFYIPEERYNEFKTQFPANDLTLISARLKNVDDTVFMQADYNKAVSNEGLYYDFIYDNAKQARTMIPVVAAIIVTVFAILLLIISLIVIRFRINNSIEENMTNIGVQKAVGYRSVQIVLAIVLQFGLVAVIGGTMGIAISLAIIPAIMKILEPMIALVWNPGFDIFSMAVSIVSALLLVILTAFISAQRINKLHPLIALRGGITTHSFRKNVFPLDKTFGPLDLLLALKQLVRNKKQAATICIIVAAVTMASVAGLAFHYNMSGGQNNFANALLGEMPDVNFMLKDADYGEELKQKMLARPEVRKAFGFETGVMILVDETGISTIIAEDCSQLEGQLIVEGRFPKHSNEIALGPAILKVAGKKVGDTVTVKSGEIERDYIVTGVSQYMNSNGFNGIITGEGMAVVQPEYKFFGYNAYLHEGSDVKKFIENVEAAEGDIFESIMDIKDNLSVVMDSMNGIFAAVAVGIAAVTVLVVILVLYIVIKTAILRRRNELGIQKALGFTTFRLMNQIALNMTPVILIGVVIGAGAGYFGLNPMVTALTGGMGIVKVNLPVPVDLTVIICAVIVILAYIVSIAVSWRIRKISAYSMIIEK
ncbi:MAG: ABC transporter permease [Oscillospiraceae bacterium]|nr:ABC transporter permease [Oscillospiraceae bacterium]